MGYRSFSKNIIYGIIIMPCGTLEEINPSMNGFGEEHASDKVKEKLEKSAENHDPMELMAQVNNTESIKEYVLGHQILMNMEQKLENDELEVKPSKLKGAGEGLYTNVTIPANNILAFYPLDLIQDLDNPAVFYEDGKEVRLEYNENNIEKVANGDYTIRMNNYRIISNKGFKPNQLYCGNLLNDRGYAPNKPYKPELNNCRFEALNIVSNRLIKAGEELCVSYGKNYWYNDIKDGKSRDDEIKDKLSE